MTSPAHPQGPLRDHPEAALAPTDGHHQEIPGLQGGSASLRQVRLVCLRCQRTPTQFALSRADGSLIHLCQIPPSARTLPRICGGRIVRMGDEWRHAIGPGAVWICHSTNRSATPHLVRLGRPGNVRSGSWTGTPLCGSEISGNGLWIPSAPEITDRKPVCAKCLAAEERDWGL